MAGVTRSASAAAADAGAAPALPRLAAIAARLFSRSCSLCNLARQQKSLPSQLGVPVSYDSVCHCQLLLEAQAERNIWKRVISLCTRPQACSLDIQDQTWQLKHAWDTA